MKRHDEVGIVAEGYNPVPKSWQMDFQQDVLGFGQGLVHQKREGEMCVVYLCRMDYSIILL